jgi:hypothetical protein
MLSLRRCTIVMNTIIPRYRVMAYSHPLFSTEIFPCFHPDVEASNILLSGYFFSNNHFSRIKILHWYNAASVRVSAIVGLFINVQELIYYEKIHFIRRFTRTTGGGL